MVDKNRRRVKFDSRYSIYCKSSKRIRFNMLEDFDFSSIKNIITIKFITPVVTAVTVMFTKTKNNLLKIKTNKPNVTILLNAKIKDINLKFINKVNARLGLYFSSKPAMLNFNTIVNGVVKFFAITKESLNFKITSNEHFILFSKSKIGLKFANIANAIVKIGASTSGNTIGFKNTPPIVAETLYAKSDPNDKLKIKVYGDTRLKINAANYNNKIAFKAYANAVVYRPTKIGDLYNVKMGDLYDKTLGELYGVELN